MEINLNPDGFKAQIVDLQKRFAHGLVGLVASQIHLTRRRYPCATQYNNVGGTEPTLINRDEIAAQISGGYPIAQVDLGIVGPGSQVCEDCTLRCFPKLADVVTGLLVSLKAKYPFGNIAVVAANDVRIIGEFNSRPCVMDSGESDRIQVENLANPEALRRAFGSGVSGVVPSYIRVGQIGSGKPICAGCSHKCFGESTDTPVSAEPAKPVEEETQLQLVDRFAYRGVHFLFNDAMNPGADFEGMGDILEANNPACIFLAVGLGVQFESLTDLPYNILAEQIKVELLKGNPRRFIDNLNRFRAELIRNPGEIRRRLGSYYESFVKVFELTHQEIEYKGVTQKISRARGIQPRYASWFVSDLPQRADGSQPNGTLVANNVRSGRRFKCVGHANRTAIMSDSPDDLYDFKGLGENGNRSKCSGCLDGYYCKVRGNEIPLEQIELDSVSTCLGFIRDNF